MARNWHSRLSALFVTGAAALAVTTATGPSHAAEPLRELSAATTGWGTAWAAAEQYPRRGFGAFENWSMDGFQDETLRQVVRLSTGGSQIRIEVSNRYGSRPLQVRTATIAKARNGASVDPATLRPLRFNGRTATSVAPGVVAISDPISFSTTPLDEVTVTLYFNEPTGPATYHDGAAATSYRARGDQSHNPRDVAFTDTSMSWYYLTGVHVRGAAVDAGTVVAFGDSLTDGYGTVPDANNRYPDELAELLAARGTPRPIANLGINGSKLLVDSPCFGAAGLTRFGEQALSEPGARIAVISIGLNDIGSAGWDVGFCGANPPVTAAQLIEAHREIVQTAHAHGLLVVGATMPPMKGHAYHTPANEEIKDEVNEWIRSSGTYDRVVDFERVLADPLDLDALNPMFDSGDHIHPNDAGRHRMAQAVLALLP